MYMHCNISFLEVTGSCINNVRICWHITLRVKKTKIKNNNKWKNNKKQTNKIKKPNKQKTQTIEKLNL